MTSTSQNSTTTPSNRKILVEFAHKHVNFQLAELESVLEIHGLLDHCVLQSLPNQSIPKEGGESFSLSMLRKQRENKSTHTNDNEVHEKNRPFVVLSFSIFKAGCGSENNFTRVHEHEEEEAMNKIVKALSECVLIKGIVELWGMGHDVESCADSVRKLMLRDDERSETRDGTHSLGAERIVSNLVQKHCVYGAKSWKITVHTFGSKYTRAEQNEMRSKFSFLPFTGDVVMDAPDEEYVLIREIEVDERGSPLYPRHSHKREIIPENDARLPLGVFFGRVLGGRRNLREGRVEKYLLKKRPYLGPTSMDAELSMVMTNLAQVRKGSFCFDPFVGTGSILLTCALKGANCFGSDIDIRVLKGKGKDENVFSNFQQFKLRRPELVRSDNSIYHRHFRSHKPMYDAIICDPPYGIRAGARKSGSKRQDVRPVEEERRHDHIAQTQPYVISDVMADLLDVAARVLVNNGRLVYIIPSMTDFDPKVDLPRHACLKMLHVCYQPLQMHLGRRVVTMQKIRDYDVSQQKAYKTAVWLNGPESAEKCARIRERLLAEARKKPGYLEKAAFRSKKRKAKREEFKQAGKTPNNP